MAKVIVKKILTESYEVFVPITVGKNKGCYQRYDFRDDGSMLWNCLVDKPR